jgi:ribonuclease J
MAVLSRIANRDHPISVGPSDTVVLASSLIPGNENSVFRVINGLARLGAHIVHKGNALVHVSGHAAAGELRYVYNLVKPRNVLPVHGEWRHMRANAEIAMSVGIPEDRVVLAEDGTVMDLVDGKVSIVGYVPVGFVYVDGSGVGDVTETSLKDRRVLGEEGFISVFLAVDIVDEKIVAGPEIHARGFGADDELVAPLRIEVVKVVEAALADGIDDIHELQQRIRRVVGKWVNTNHRRRPMIIPVVVEA